MNEIEKLIDFYFESGGESEVLESLTTELDEFLSNYIVDYLIVKENLERLAFIDDPCSEKFLLTVLHNLRIIYVPSVKNGVVSFISAVKEKVYDNITYLRYLDAILTSNPSLINYVYPLEFLMELIVKRPENSSDIMESISLLYNITFDKIYFREILRVFEKVGFSHQQCILDKLARILESGEESQTDLINQGILFWLERAELSVCNAFHQEFGRIYEAILGHSGDLRCNDQSINELVQVSFLYPQFFKLACQQLTIESAISPDLQESLIVCICRLQHQPGRRSDAVQVLELLLRLCQSKYEVLVQILKFEKENLFEEAVDYFHDLCLSEVEDAQRWLHNVTQTALQRPWLLSPILEIAETLLNLTHVHVDFMEMAAELLVHYTEEHNYLEFRAICFATRIVQLVGANVDVALHYKYVTLLLKYYTDGVLRQLAKAALLRLVYRLPVSVSFFALNPAERKQYVEQNQNRICISEKLLKSLCEQTVLEFDDLLIISIYIGKELIDKGYMERRRFVAKLIIDNIMHFWQTPGEISDDASLYRDFNERWIGERLLLILSPFAIPNKVKFLLVSQKTTISQSLGAKYIVIHIIKTLRLIFKAEDQEFEYLFELPTRQFKPDHDIFIYGPNSNISKIQAPSALLFKIANLQFRITFSLESPDSQVLEMLCPEKIGSGITVSVSEQQLHLRFFDIQFCVKIGEVSHIDLKIIVESANGEADGVEDVIFGELYNKNSGKYSNDICSEISRIQVFVNGKPIVNMPFIMPYHCCVLLQQYSIRLFKDVFYSRLSATNDGWDSLRLSRGEIRVYSIYVLHNEAKCCVMNLLQETLRIISEESFKDLLCSQNFVRYEEYFEVLQDGDDKIIKYGTSLSLDAQSGGKSSQGNIIFKTVPRNEEDRTPQLSYSFKTTFCKHLPSSRVEKFVPTYENSWTSFGVLTNIPYLSTLMSELAIAPEEWISFDLKYFDVILSISPRFYDNFLQACEFQNLLHFIELRHNTEQISYDVIIEILKLAGFVFVYNAEIESFELHSVNRERLYSLDSLWCVLESNLWDCDDLQFVFFMLIETILSDETQFSFLDRYELYELLFNEVIFFAPKTKNMDELLKCLKNVSFSFLLYYVGSANEFFESSSYTQIYRVSTIINQAFGQCCRLFGQRHPKLAFDIFMQLIGNYVFQFDEYFIHLDQSELGACKQLFFVAELWSQPFVTLLARQLDTEQRRLVIQVVHIIVSAQDILRHFDYENELEPKLYSIYSLKRQNEEFVHIERELENYGLDFAFYEQISTNRYIGKLTDEFQLDAAANYHLLMPFAFIKLVQMKSNEMSQLQIHNALATARTQVGLSAHICYLMVPLTIFRTYVQNFKIPSSGREFFEQQLLEQQLLDMQSIVFQRISDNLNPAMLEIVESFLQFSKPYNYEASIAEMMQFSHSGLYHSQNCKDKIFILDLAFSIIYSTVKEIGNQLYLILLLVLHIIDIIEDATFEDLDDRILKLMLQSLMRNLEMLVMHHNYLKFCVDKDTEVELHSNLFITILKATFFFTFQLAVKHEGSLCLNVFQYKELNVNTFYPEVKLLINDEEEINQETSSFVVCCLVEEFGMLCDANRYLISDIGRCSFGECRCQGKYTERPIAWELSDTIFSHDYKYLVEQTLLLFNCLQFKEVFSKEHTICHFYIGVLSLEQYQLRYNEHYDIQQSMQLVLYQILFSDPKELIESTTFADLMLRSEPLLFIKQLKIDSRHLYQEATININLSGNIEFMHVYDQFSTALGGAFEALFANEAINSIINQFHRHLLLIFHSEYQLSHYEQTLKPIESYNYETNVVDHQFSHFGAKRQTNYNLDQIFKSLAAKDVSTYMSIDTNIYTSNVDVYNRFASGEATLPPGIVLHESQVFNGENYQRSIPHFYECKHPIVDVSPLIISLFEYFEQLSTPFFNALFLDHICNKACKLYVYHSFIYLLIDTPKNQFFQDIVNEFGEAGSILQEAVRGALNAQSKTSTVHAKISSPLFNQAEICRILIGKIISIFERDYGGINSALDIYTSDGQCFGFAFPTNAKCKDFLREIIAREPQMLRIVTSIASNNSRLIQAVEQVKPAIMPAYTKTPFNKYLQMLIKAWQEEEINAFQFITELNILANRSYSDISQYPIFPVLFGCNTSNNSLETRALQLPVICQSRTRLRTEVEKLIDAAAFGNEEEQLSSVHFAHCAVSANYMIRIEPWMSSHMMLEQGKLDEPDRLFRSIAIQYSNALESDENCEESVPEAFYDGSIYLNSNSVSFGATERGEVVHNVTMPSLFDTAEQFVQFNSSLLESEELRGGLFEWVEFMFSDKNATIDGVDLCACLGLSSPYIQAELPFYPRLTKFCVFNSAEIGNSLAKYKELSREPTLSSSALKLVYFGRQPRAIFSHAKVLKFSEKECHLNEQNLAGNFMEQYMEIYMISPISIEEIKKVKDLQIIFEIETSFLVWQMIPHFNREIDCLEAGFLFGRREEQGNIPARAAAGVNYRDDELQIQYKAPILSYDALNEKNSLSYANNYFIPRSYKYLQNCYGEFVCQLQEGCILVYELPHFQLFMELQIGDASDITPTHALSAQNSATNEFLITREYGVMDVIGVDFGSGKLIYMHNIAICNAPLLSVHYNHAWSVAIVVSSRRLTVINMECMQVWFRVKCQHECSNIIVFGQVPLMIAMYDTYSRIFDLRYAREYNRIQYNRLFLVGTGVCGVHDNQIFVIKNFYEQAQKGKLDIEWIGTTNLGEIKSVMMRAEDYFASVDCGGKFLLCTFKK